MEENKEAEEALCEKELTKKELKAEKKKQKKDLKEAKKKLGGFFLDFKKFISKGNIIDLAVAVVIGTAFTKIVNIVVSDIIMPLLGLIIGDTSYESLNWHITETISINFGTLITAIIDFLLIAFFIFLILRAIVNAERGFKGFTKKIKKKINEDNSAAETTEVIIEEVVTVKIESTEDILKDIRTLLLELNGKNKETENNVEIKEKIEDNK